MEITEVKVTLVDQDQLKAYVALVLDHCFVVRDVKVIYGPKGHFVAMPSKKRKDGTFRDIAHPINRETREKMEKAILAAYEKAAGDSLGDVRALAGDPDQDGEEGGSDPESREISA